MSRICLEAVLKTDKLTENFIDNKLNIKLGMFTEEKLDRKAAGLTEIYLKRQGNLTQYFLNNATLSTNKIH